MRKIKLLITLILVCGLSTEVCAVEKNSEDYKEQLNKIDLFYEVLNKKAPKISDFFKLFGSDNESELELILRHDFPSLKLEEWDLNKKAADHVSKIFARPTFHVSRFLKCLKVKEPAIFKTKAKYRVEMPPEVTNDFRRFTVSTDNDQKSKIIFEFSQNEPYIESIILPDGKSIYTLIDNCGK